jgi:hypothetical protein
LAALAREDGAARRESHKKIYVVALGAGQRFAIAEGRIAIEAPASPTSPVDASEPAAPSDGASTLVIAPSVIVIAAPAPEASSAPAAAGSSAARVMAASLPRKAAPGGTSGASAEPGAGIPGNARRERERDERVYLEVARERLAAGHPNAARSVLRAHDRRFPEGGFAEERAALRASTRNVSNH